MKLALLLPRLPFVLLAGAVRTHLGYRSLTPNEPGMAAWYGTILEDISRFGR